MMKAFPADAISKRVMHSYVTAPRYDWPEADFPFGQTAVYHRSVTSYRSPCFPEFSPLVRGSGETARWQKVEINESINQISSLCHFFSAADIGLRRKVPIRIKKSRLASNRPDVRTQEHRMSECPLEPLHRIVFKDNVVL